MSSLSPAEKATIRTAFNRQGYVLDFSNSTFGQFTVESIGYDIQAMYGASKGKSLESYIAEADTVKAIKLVSDLLEYYEGSSLPETEPIPTNVVQKLKEIIRRHEPNEATLSTARQALSLRESFDDSFTDKQIQQMVSSIELNPSDSIGKAKELLESCLKTILIERATLSANDLAKKDIPELIKTVREELGIKSDYKEVNQIIGGMSGVASGIAQLRNSKGTGHGRPMNHFREPSSIEARLAIDSTVTVIHFFWSLHKKTSSELNSKRENI